ncbi:hypothetical protein [Blastopirellula marina]|uniref:Carboxypeptidase regulatory-like domain-containing protein n=1 Tax=Blastopirellula marina DSM 3645 TaxID=314230 RepID=A3ZLS0_9BACT|nr:hypothetical protein [Blastopirellula marina]EAQ82703.1 hypothetical protein DSM3645_09897 [Blastopirellula marina DSM 3645]
MNPLQNAIAVNRAKSHLTALLQLAAGSCCLIALIGCGSNPYLPVSGTVLLDGQPLEDAKLIFEPIGDSQGNTSGRPSYGRTDASGQYSLHCPIADQDGAAIGQHRVRIVTTRLPTYTDAQRSKARALLQKQETEGGNPNAEITEEMVNNYLSDVVRVVAPKETLPAKYNSQTELEFTVKASGDNQADFDLQSGR